MAKPPFFLAYSRLCRHCHNLAEGSCLLSRFHFTLCRYFLGQVAWQGLFNITSINLTNICLLFDLFFSNYIYTQKLILFFFVFASTFRPTMPGYELSSTDRTVIDKKNLCPKCEGLLREAVQTIACGHRYCKTCVETILW